MINRKPQMVKNTGPVLNTKGGGCRDMVPSAGSYKGRSVFWDKVLFWDNHGLERFMIRSFHCRNPVLWTWSCICGCAQYFKNKLVKAEIRISKFETNSNLECPNDRNIQMISRYMGSGKGGM